MSDVRLTIWTLYEHPLDAPNEFVIRGHDVLVGGAVRPQPSAYFAETREKVTEIFQAQHPGLHWIGRELADEPQIVGSWV